MTPILVGRWQTRLAMLASLGVIVTTIYAIAFDSLVFFGVLLWVLLFGIVWDVVFNALQSLRWDRDWPAAFHTATGVAEGVLLFVVISLWGLPGIPQGSVSLPLFIAHYGSVWLVIFAWVEGPMRAFFPFWRFHGSRLLPVVAPTARDRRQNARQPLPASVDRRPPRVTFSGLFFLASAMYLATTGTLLVFRPELLLQLGSMPGLPQMTADIISGVARVLGGLVTGLAILYLGVGMGLMAGRGWARIAGLIIAALFAVLGIIGFAFVLSGAQPATVFDIVSGLVFTVIYVLVLVALASTGSYFRGGLRARVT